MTREKNMATLKLAQKNILKHASLAFGCLAVAAPLLAQTAAPAAPTPDWVNAGNVSLLSDYIFRGVSQTQGRPIAQATLDFTHTNGFYLGLFGSGVSYAAYNNTSGAEVDLYGGYRHSLSADSNIDVGLVTYWYPGAHYMGDGHDITYHTQEVKIGFNKGSFNAYAWASVSKNWFGFGVDPVSGKYADSRGSTYFETNWNPEISSGLVVNLHAGRQSIRHFGDFDFYDVKLGVTKTWDTWALSAGVTHNSGDARKGALSYWTFFDADGKGKDVVGTRLLLSASRVF
jgi:uncharacterized protein (TIGR02001 family)